MKVKKNSFLRGIIYLLVSQIFIKIVGFAYKFYLINKPGFGDEGNAIYSSGFQIYALLLAFSSTGVSSAISKLVSEELAIGDSKGAHRIFKISLITFSIFGIIGSALLFFEAKKISINWIQIPKAENSLVCLAPSIFFVSIISVFRGYYNGRQKFEIMAKSQMFEQIFKTVFTIVLVELVIKLQRKETYIMAGAANLATTFATIICFLYIYLHYQKESKNIKKKIQRTNVYKVNGIRKTIKKILSDSVPISLGSIIASFNKTIDSLTVVRFLKHTINEEDAIIQYGILSGKVDIICSAVIALNVAFVTAFIPSIVRSYTKKDYKNMYKKIRIFIITTIIIGIPYTLLMMLFPDKILKILFPNASSGAVYLKFSSISIIFMLLTQTVNTILQALGKVKIPPISLGIGLIFKLICNISLIPNSKIGIFGAIIGNISYNIISFFISTILLLKVLFYIKISMNNKEEINKGIKI